MLKLWGLSCVEIGIFEGDRCLKGERNALIKLEKRNHLAWITRNKLDSSVLQLTSKQLPNRELRLNLIKNCCKLSF